MAPKLAILLTTLAALLLPEAGLARDAAQACRATKNLIAGKYAACLHKAESRFVIGGETDAEGLAAAREKCVAKLDKGWARAEDKAPGSCVRDGDDSSIVPFLDACVDGVIGHLDTNDALPLDPQSCTSELGDCTAELSVLDAGLADCEADPCLGSLLPACQSALSSNNADLSACAANLASTNADLGNCNGIFLPGCESSLSSAEADSISCASQLVSTNAGIATCNDVLVPACNADLSSATAAFASCSGTLDDCNADLADCTGTLASCSAGVAPCLADLASCGAGTATAADAVSGETFSSSAGLGATGTMPDRGAVSLFPTTSNSAIAAGRHNGSGSCAGDADLVAANVLAGVKLFGVTGAAPPLAPLPGPSRSFTDNGNGTITDNQTKLTWEKLSDDSSIHDHQRVREFAESFDKIDALNSASFGGYTDWRMPNVRELLSLTNFATDYPATFNEFDTDCVPGCTVLTCSCSDSAYWSSTTATEAYHAWIVYSFSDGSSRLHHKSSDAGTRAVRGGL